MRIPLVAHENGRGTLQLPAEFHGAAEICLEDEAGGRQVLPLNHGEDGVLWVALPALALRLLHFICGSGRRRPQVRLVAVPQSVYQPKTLEHGLHERADHAFVQPAFANGTGVLGILHDLLDLMAFVADKQLDFVGINPLHALSVPACFCQPVQPVFARMAQSDLSGCGKGRRVYLQRKAEKLAQAAEYLPAHCGVVDYGNRRLYGGLGVQARCFAEGV